MNDSPPGFDKKDPVDPTTIEECWITPDSSPNLKKYALDPNISPFLEDYIIMACGMINRMCNRKFNQQQYDQILPNQLLTIRDYKTFVLSNRPLVSIDEVWVQVVNTFALLDPTYFQIMTYEGIVKILPQFNVYVQTTLPMFSLASASNIWIRFTSGYKIDRTDPDNVINEVPFPVQKATALMVDWLVGMDNITPNLSSFRTQTYSETTANASEDPIKTRVEMMLKPYKLNTLI